MSKPLIVGRLVAVLRQTAEARLVQDGGRKTPLHCAIANGNSTVAALLLALRADVRYRGSFGWTPLHYAAAYGNRDTAELLVAGGADVDTKDDEERTPLAALAAGGAAIDATDANEMTPLHYAALKNTGRSAGEPGW